MKYILPAIAIAFLLLSQSCNKATSVEMDVSPVKVENDPLDAHIYKLENGLTIFVTEYDDEPRIQTLVAVKAGSKFDPAETTGLAHYLEHMLFKGTDRLGTKDWESESALLDQISNLYEQHKAEKDPEKKAAIYKMIDSVSYEASKYAIPNEYDKMINSMGAKSTNAYTSNDRTVYMNDIPSNELEKWMMIESERFSQLVLRLFHTELETVYEEFNRSQDRDSRWTFEAILRGLFPNHPYGTQSTIGVGEHLKNPSMINIHNYFNKYYVPNNIAIVLSGAVDPQEALALAEKYFGDWEMREIEEFTFNRDEMPSEPIVTNHYGPQPEHVYIGYGMGGANSQDALYLKLIDGLLSNAQAGLIDINLVQGQKVLNAYAFPFIRKDYSAHYLYGQPKQGQELENVKDLLLSQIENIRQGNFDEGMMKAVIKNYELMRLKDYESNFSRAHDFVEAFTEGVEWEDYVDEVQKMKAIKKEDLVTFANSYYGDNYVVAYKHIGEDPNRHKVEKPKITPIVVNRDVESEFVTEFKQMSSSTMTPKFLDFDKDISRTALSSNIPFNYVHNKYNNTFTLTYIYDIGTFHDREMALAFQYLPLLGTDEYTAEELQKKMYALGLSFDVSAGDKRSSVSLSGLEESLEEGVKLLEHIIANVKPDQKKYDEFVSDILQKRMDRKRNKRAILFNGLVSRAKYGEASPFTYVFSEDELKNMDISMLASKIHTIAEYDHRIFYYGSKKMEAAKDVVQKHHITKEQLKQAGTPVEFPERDIKAGEIYFADYDMVQAEIVLVAKDDKFNKDLLPYSLVFNEYFGSGLSSIVFQEIREQKALAYSAYSVYRAPDEFDESHYIYAYVGTQADKLGDAIKEIKRLLNDMPEVEEQFQGSRKSAIKKLETDWITKASIYWAYESAKRRNLDYDVRKDNYEVVKEMELADLKQFFNEHIKGKDFAICVIGSKDNVDFDVLEEYGSVKELSLEEIFNY